MIDFKNTDTAVNDIITATRATSQQVDNVWYAQTVADGSGERKSANLHNDLIQDAAESDADGLASLPLRDQVLINTILWRTSALFDYALANNG